MSWAPPHDCQLTLVTRPVGSPPLKILRGLARPKPVPWANTPASLPSTGTGLAGPIDPAPPDGCGAAALAGADPGAGSGAARRRGRHGCHHGNRGCGVAGA